MTAFLSILTSRLTGPLMAALSVVLIVMLVGAKIETGKVKADLRAQVDLTQTRTGERDKCRFEYADLEAKRIVQNAAIEKAEAQGRAMAAAAEKAASDTRRAQRRADAEAARYANFKPGATCEEQQANVAELVAGVVR